MNMFRFLGKAAAFVLGFLGKAKVFILGLPGKAATFIFRFLCKAVVFVFRYLCQSGCSICAVIVFQRSAVPHLRVRSDLHSEDGGSTFYLNAVISI
jgi:hypothetical protein